MRFQNSRAKPSGELFEDRVDVLGAKNHDLFAIDLDFGSAVLAIEHTVAFLHGHGNEVTVLVELALAHLEDNARLGLFLRVVREDEATCGGFLCFVLLQKFKLSVPKVIGIAAVLGLVCFGVF